MKFPYYQTIRFSDNIELKCAGNLKIYNGRIPKFGIFKLMLWYHYKFIR